MLLDESIVSLAVVSCLSKTESLVSNEISDLCGHIIEDGVVHVEEVQTENPGVLLILGLWIMHELDNAVVGVCGLFKPHFAWKCDSLSSSANIKSIEGDVVNIMRASTGTGHQFVWLLNTCGLGIKVLLNLVVVCFWDEDESCSGINDHSICLFVASSENLVSDLMRTIDNWNGPEDIVFIFLNWIPCDATSVVLSICVPSSKLDFGCIC